jgi:hypothetical protein
VVVLAGHNKPVEARQFAETVVEGALGIALLFQFQASFVTPQITVGWFDSGYAISHIARFV